MAVYHRVESPTQTPETAALQEKSGRIMGRPARGSNIPKVKAYAGPLSEGQRGVEFETDLPPDLGHVPGQPTWSVGTPGVFAIESEMVFITVRIIKNSQKEVKNL